MKTLLPPFVSVLLFILLPIPLQALTNKVLILGIDGTMTSALEVANTPNLDALKAQGSYSHRVISHPVTHSAAAWSSLFTGVWGDKHGVNDPGNSFSGNRFLSYPSFYKRLEDFNPDWNTYAFARWAPMLTAVPDADVRQSFGSDPAAVAETCRILTNGNPDVIWSLQLNVDSAGHSSGWGPNVPNYVAAIETADAGVGQIIQCLTNRASYAEEDWLVIVTTDHGQHDHPDLERSRVTWSIVSGRSAGRGVTWPSPAIVDTCATVLTHMGVPIDPAWNLDARVDGLPLPPSAYGTNLIFNGDAETASGTNGFTPNRGITWWFDLHGATVGVYGSNASFPSAGSPGPADRGNNFFLGGAGASGISQRIEIPDVASDVDGVGVTYELSGWFGGFGGQDDAAELTATFLDAGGAALGSDAVGGVTAEDRGGVTGLLERSGSGLLPVGTRFVEFALTNRLASGMNDASADNLSFVLMPVVVPPFLILSQASITNTWSVLVQTTTNRLYVLERSEFLADWIDVTAPVQGGAESLRLIDPAPPARQAFYRVRCLNP